MNAHGIDTCTLAIVGNAGSVNVGESLRRAASSAGRSVIFFNTYDANAGHRVLKALAWRLNDRRPARLRQFQAGLLEACTRTTPDILIATGIAPLTQPSLRALKALGIICVNYSTDDPWNPTLRAHWHLRALPDYDVVFTPRRANLNDFAELGCPDVRYLPFGYDETLFAPSLPSEDAPCPDTLFAGGADRDRVAFMTEFVLTEPNVGLVGGYWDRYPRMKPFALGHMAPERLSALTRAAKVNLCLVRRANRDGHVMRSFEIAAIGGCMLVEDTAEHREIFGPDGECVVYFRTPAEAATRARALIAAPSERARLASSVQARISQGGHTYRHRLAAMLENLPPRKDGSSARAA